MINIVTGSINSGKTTRLKEIYQDDRTGDGFILPKKFKDEKFIGQKIIRLSTGKGSTFSRRVGYIPEGWNEKYHYRIFSFSQKGLDFASDIIEDIITDKVSPVFIDEIGPLELDEKGFYPLLTKVLKTKSTIYIAIRKNLLKKVVKKFNIDNYHLIKV